MQQPLGDREPDGPASIIAAIDTSEWGILSARALGFLAADVLDVPTILIARQSRKRGISAHAELQVEECSAEKLGYAATRHKREVGTGDYDHVNQVISGGPCSTWALDDSTEAAQF